MIRKSPINLLIEDPHSVSWTVVEVVGLCHLLVSHRCVRSADGLARPTDSTGTDARSAIRPTHTTNQIQIFSEAVVVDWSATSRRSARR